jgi:hypothetical protein
MKNRPEWDLVQQAQMRTFFRSCGVSTITAENAIKVRRNEPIEKKRVPLRGARRKLSAKIG